MSNSLKRILGFMKFARLLCALLAGICALILVVCALDLAGVTKMRANPVFDLGGALNLSDNSSSEAGEAVSLYSSNIGGVVVSLSPDAHSHAPYIAMQLIRMLLSLSEGILAVIALLHFNHVLNAGTPFTPAGARELFRLGVLTICLPVAALLISLLIGRIVAPSADMSTTLRLEPTAFLGAGLILVSMLLQHACEKMPSADTESARMQ